MQKTQNGIAFFTMHILFLRFLRLGFPPGAVTLKRMIFKIAICSLIQMNIHISWQNVTAYSMSIQTPDSTISRGMGNKFAPLHGPWTHSPVSGS